MHGHGHVHGRVRVAGQELGKLKAEVNQLRAAEALQLDEIAQIGKDPLLDVAGNGGNYP